jgi:lipoic acid synthetase
MILGDVCTRACKYCAVAHGMPTELDLDEPRRVTESVVQMELEHVVITSVNRDELPDGGAGIYAETIRRIHEAVPGCSVEVLIPDFKGDEGALATVLEAEPAILGHNLETVDRLHPDVRPGGRYWRSISFLGASKKIAPDILTKTGIILGMGEEPDEVRQAMSDLREAAVDILTLGQYLRPSPMHIPVARWVTPAEFAQWKRIGEEEYGFRHVESGPLVRSSYHAKEQAREVVAGGPGKIRDVMEADIAAPAEVLPTLNLVQLEMGRPGRDLE